jgi:hypothetical protein
MFKLNSNYSNSIILSNYSVCDFSLVVLVQIAMRTVSTYSPVRQADCQLTYSFHSNVTLVIVSIGDSPSG